MRFRPTTRILVSVLFSMMLCSSFAQPYASWDGSLLTLDNGMIQRQVFHDPDNGSVSTVFLSTEGDTTSYLSEDLYEFSFTVNGERVTGRDPWILREYQLVSEDFEGEGARLILEATGGPAEGLQVGLTYLLYPALPVIRKYISLTNTSGEDLNIENLDMEHLVVQGNQLYGWLRDENSWIQREYGRNRTIGPYRGDHHDPVIPVHDILRRRVIALGNEAPGVMKRTGVFLDGKSATIGMNYSNEHYPFRKWLEPGESWESPRAFLALLENCNDPFQVIDGPVNDFVRRHMGIRLAELPEKPAFVYNTWNPFRMDVSEGLVMELATEAAACGVEEFIIDAGWSTNFGDWEIDREKFPRGLKPVFDSIRTLGMKPGLWISMAGAAKESKVFREHPEWFIQDSSGRTINLHQPFEGMKTACMGTGWLDYIKSVILGLVREHGLEYAKLDFAIVTSAYRYDPEISGCHATGHPWHRDRLESHLALYRRAWKLFDELHQEAPGLFIDCTFETMGAMQLIDYDMCKHAEGNWLSNFEEPGALGALRVRHMAWWRSPAIPAGSMVIGNLAINDPEVELYLKSLAGVFPIMLGDPRKVPVEKMDRLMQWSGWLKSMQNRHNYMMFRQDLPGFGEPQEGSWDGFQRINTDIGSGGIVGVFRHGSGEKQRQVFINYLDPEREYEVLYGPGEKLIGAWSGRELQEQGFPIVLEKKYDGMLFEIRWI
jgi:alpha-galactosidase